MFTAIRCFISNLIKMFAPAEQTVTEMRLQQLEHDVNRLNKVLEMHEVSIAVSDSDLSAHRDTLISKSVMAWLANWLNDKYVSQDDIETVVSDAVSDHDFTDVVDDCINSRDWDYELREAVDWDKVADKVADKLDWSTIISDNEIVCSGDYDFDDMMLKSDHMSDDELVTRADLSDMVVGELKRDWFEQMLKDEVRRIFKDTLQSVRSTEEGNCRNAIDDEIENRVAIMVDEQMRQKFGDSFDIWFHNIIAHGVKQVISEMIIAAHKQVVSDTEESK